MSLWAARARSAERAVYARHVRRLWLQPGTLLGVVAWPSSRWQRLHLGPWHYWWQAHLLDCALDAYLRGPSPGRRAVVDRLARGVRVRNLRRGWLNGFYDDVAWLGLALQRASAAAGVHHHGAVACIRERLRSGWSDAGGGGIWWHIGSDFKNAPANGPAAILLARCGDTDGAVRIADWMEDCLVEPDNGLVWDGVRVGGDGTVHTVEKQTYTYCQGVYLGACVELARRTGDVEWVRRARRTVAAVNTMMTNVDGVLRTHGRGDGGLFTGILARYLAQAALRLPGDSQADRIARQTAADLVLTSAIAAWRHRAVAAGGPLFGADWSVPAPPSAVLSGRRGGAAERDLSVQLSGWMLCEAAAFIERQRPDLL